MLGCVIFIMITLCFGKDDRRYQYYFSNRFHVLLYRCNRLGHSVEVGAVLKRINLMTAIKFHQVFILEAEMVGLFAAPIYRRVNAFEISDEVCIILVEIGPCTCFGPRCRHNSYVTTN